MQNSARSFRGLLLLAGLILTIHTLVPHVHGAHFITPGETSTSTNHETPFGWLDLLTDLVDADMGEDHLENFSPEKTIDFTLVVPTFLPTLPSALFAERFLFQPETAVRVEQAPSPSPQIKEVFLRQVALRGPPASA